MGVPPPPRGASLVNWDHMTRPLFHSDSLKLIKTECEKLEKHTSSREVKLLKPLGMNKKDKKHITPYASGKMKCIQLFRERLSEKMCTRQSRKVIWDMLNTLFLTLLLSNLLLLLSFSTGRHMSMTSPAILSNFFEKE